MRITRTATAVENNTMIIYLIRGISQSHNLAASASDARRWCFIYDGNLPRPAGHAEAEQRGLVGRGLQHVDLCR